MRSRSHLPSFRLSAVVVTVAILVVLAPKMADAARGRTYFVAPSGSDAIACSGNSQTQPFASIQKAIGCSVDGDVVNLAPSGATPYPGIGAIGENVTIQAQAGANARTVTIDAGKGELSVSPGAVVAVSGASLSCVANDCGAPTVTNEGTLKLSGDTVSGNFGVYSAILNTTPAGSSTPASLSIESSTVSGNAGRVGGGVQSSPGNEASGPLSLTIANSTIAGDFAQSRGGGVSVVNTTADSSATIVNSTITANSAPSGGGGLYAGSPVVLSNTILAGNTTRSGVTVDCEDKTGMNVSDGVAGHNLIGSGSGCPRLVGGVDGDQVGVPRPGLLALANNGGATDTVALQSGSPAIGAGDAGACALPSIADRDQRGEARRSALRGCDGGAYDTGGHGGVVDRTYFVAPSGSDAVACSANSSVQPFASIQKAIGCSVDGDVVNLAPSGATPYPGIGAIGENVTIQAQAGANARTVTIDAGKGELSVSPGAVVAVSGASLRCVANDCGAPTVINEGTLRLSGDMVSGNFGVYSGILNTTPAGSSTPASLSVERSTVSGNAGRFGGGIQSSVGSGASGPLSLTIANSTIAGNFSQTHGGGLSVTNTTAGSSATIVNSTITANSSPSGGGGLYAASSVGLSNTILAANTTRSGVALDCEDTTGKNASDGPAGHNLIGSGSGCQQLVGGGDGDQVGSAASLLDPRLAPLAYDGGATETEPLLPGSPAIGAGSATACEVPSIGDKDQRGAARKPGRRDVCDVGAYDTGGTEPKTSPVALTSPAAASATVGSPLQIALKAKGTPTPALSVSGTLPAGVTLIDSGDGKGSLSGVPSPGTAGTYAVTIIAKNGLSPDSSRSLTLTVEDLAASGVSPAQMLAGREATVTVTGTGFQPGATVMASDPAIAFSSVRVKSSTTITAKETVTVEAPAGSYDLSVSVPGASSTCGGCLIVASPGQ
jgi:hypothetical protein